jgi:hypothetical protein
MASDGSGDLILGVHRPRCHVRFSGVEPEKPYSEFSTVFMSSARLNDISFVDEDDNTYYTHEFGNNFFICDDGTIRVMDPNGGSVASS